MNDTLCRISTASVLRMTQFLDSNIFVVLKFFHVQYYARSNSDNEAKNKTSR
jgi:hypothetical protein